MKKSLLLLALALVALPSLNAFAQDCSSTAVSIALKSERGERKDEGSKSETSSEGCQDARIAEITQYASDLIAKHLVSEGYAVSVESSCGKTIYSLDIENDSGACRLVGLSKLSSKR